VVFIESRAFTVRLDELAGNQAFTVLTNIQEGLLKNPDRGNLVQGLGGIRKARTSDPGRGKGKRGGFRYMYLHLEHRSHIHLLFVFGKNEQEDLDSDQRAAIRGWVTEINNEGETGWRRKPR
jgi:hypothetical protein